jgi:hypothetical protein
MELDNWSQVPDNNLGAFEYAVKHDDDNTMAVGYTHADPGYVVWTTEGQLHEGGAEARLGFYPDESDAEQRVHEYAADHADVQLARQAVRGTGDAAKGVADPKGMDENLPYSAFGGGSGARRRVEDNFESVEELAEASDAHLKSFDGVGPTTIDNLRSWLADEGYADEDPTTPDPDTAGDLNLEVEPSGLERDDPATEITGVGDRSNLSTETAGVFWERGCPFHEVAGAWEDEAFRDVLGSEFFDRQNPDHLVRLFAGWTAAYAYDENGEQLGNYAEAMFGQFDWDRVRWAWADHGFSSDFQDAAAADEVLEKQGAVAAGDELPFERLDFDPEEDHGLSGLHGVRSVDTYYDDSEGMFFEYQADVDAEQNEVYIPKATVELYSLLFGANFSDPSVASDHLYVVADTSRGAEAKQMYLYGPGRDPRYIAVFDHPSADAYGIAEGEAEIEIRPSDFDLTEPSEYDAWAEQVAEQVEERREAFEQEMQRGPNTYRQAKGVSPARDLDDAAGTGPRDDYRPEDRTRENREEAWDEMMGEIYDPSREVEENIAAAEDAGVMDPDDGDTPEPSGADRGDLDDPTLSAEVGGKTYHFPIQIGKFKISTARVGLYYANEDSPFQVSVEQHPKVRKLFEFRLSHEDENAAEYGEEFESKKGTGRTPKDFFEWFNSLEATGQADPQYPEEESTGIPERDDPPEAVAGYSLDVNDPESGMYEWTAPNGGGPPATISRSRGWTTEVQAIQHPGTEYRWSLRVRYRQGTELESRTVSREHSKGGTTSPDEARQRNRRRILARAAEWMEENPGDEGDEGDEADDQDDGGTIYDEYPDQRITEQRLRHHFGADLPESDVRRLKEAFVDIQSLSGAVYGQVKDLEGDTSRIRTELFGEYTDDDLTVAHAQKRMGDADQDGGQDDDDGHDQEAAREHREAVRAARDADGDGDLPGPALQALKKNWSRYKQGLKEGREAAEEVEQYRESREEAEEAAAIINDIREAHGQEPIDFDGVDEIPEVDRLGGPITDDDPGVSLGFSWDADPYDPTEEV